MSTHDPQGTDDGGWFPFDQGDPDTLTRLRQATQGHYRIGERLGRGGMASVYAGQDLILERPVAIKVLRSELSAAVRFVTRFQREARTAARLDHPGIIPIYAVESSHDLHYIVMKFVDGQSLEEILKGDPLPVETCRRIVWEAAVALGYAHQRGVIHRDVKPGNIMVGRQGNVVVTDFGISKAMEEASGELTATGQLLGTPLYMSPEQAEGRALDGRADQYALGVVAYRMLTGTLPFGEGPIQVILYRQVSQVPRPIREQRPEVPEALDRAIARSMSKNPADRFPTMEAFATAVWPERPVAAGAPVPLPTPSGASVGARVEAAGRLPRARRLAVAGALVAAVAAAGALAILLLNGGGTPEAAGTPAEDSAATAIAEDLSAGQQAAAPGKPAAAQPAQTSPPARLPQTSAAEDPAPAAPPPAAKPRSSQPEPSVGYVTVSATPFGTVYVDGLEIGDTPLVRHELTPGVHELRITRPGFVTVVDTIVITAGNEHRTRKTLLPVP
jgi:serine/threonine-protein kinase